MPNQSPSGCLYVVATPIGNPQDITLRAVATLESVSAVICEEQRTGSTLLKKLGLQKEILLLNEHNEAENAPLIAQRILLQNEQMALISDCGTPVFADPGASLIRHLTDLGVPVIPIPGPSSLAAALSVLPVKLDRFYFAGFLSRDRDERRREMKYLRSLRIPVVLMDAPYRLTGLMEDVAQVFGDGVKATLCLDLTLPGERILNGPLAELRRAASGKKAEFILILH